MKIRWVRRNWPIGMVPYVQKENGLPTGQRVMVFLPHSDDGRYIGGLLYWMNGRIDRPSAVNRMRIVVVASGYRSVVGELTREQKAEIRKGEAICWAEMLGFTAGQVMFPDAEETYEKRLGIRIHDQERIDGLLAAGRPTMIFVPHISDTAQHINYYTRKMAVNAAVKWLVQVDSHNRQEPGLFVVEYPTNHVPLLPPSDKNLIIAFSSPVYAEIKYRANQAHLSQESKCFNMLGKFAEAIGALQESDDTYQIARAGRRFARYLSNVEVNPRKSRSEHCGVTYLAVDRTAGREPMLVEQRLNFPLTGPMRQRWFSRSACSR